MIEEQLLKNEEKAVFALRSLYRRYGYLPYHMSKFEEYELYLRNKDFLVSDRVITFNDTNGKLMALKPDVTLSIIKNGEDAPGCKQKLYYDENVYRVSDRTRHYKEIMQTGLECIGSIDLYDVYEVISLAAQSLALISPDFVLEISQLDLISALLEQMQADQSFCRKALHCIAAKNAHDLTRLCGEHGLSADDTERLTALITVYGERGSVISRLRELGGLGERQLERLSELSSLLERSPFSDRIIFDFSVVNDMNYYNGFVFKGFLDGISDGVLAGGQYDRMMQRMQRSSGAIGFALYLDLLEQLPTPRTEYDVDVLLLYSAENSSAEVAQKVTDLLAAGLTVSAQCALPDKLRYKRLIDLTKGAKQC